MLVEVKLISACGQMKGQQVHVLNRSRSSSTLGLPGLFSLAGFSPRVSWIVKLSPCGNCPAKFSFEHSYFSTLIGKASELVIFFLEKTSSLP